MSGIQKQRRGYLVRLAVSVVLLFGLLGAGACVAAQDAATVGAVKRELLDQLERDRYLTPQAAEAARAHYLGTDDATPAAAIDPVSAAAAQPSVWARYLSWTNFIKVAGVICLLVAFAGAIRRFGERLRYWIAQVPKEVYQSVLLALTLVCSLLPQALWAAQAYYLALFGVFANLLLLGWIVESHRAIWRFVAHLCRFGPPPASLVGALGVLYFGAFALLYQSQIFGFFAVVCLSSVLSFGVYYRPGVLTLYFHDKATAAVVLGHLIVLAVYAGLKIAALLPAAAGLFALGLEYYCTIALGVGFLVGASPYYKRRSVAAYLALFAGVLFAAVAGYFLFDLKVIGSIVCCFAALLALEWISYLSYRINFIVGTFAMGVALFSGALLLERYASFIVLRLA